MQLMVGEGTSFHFLALVCTAISPLRCQLNPQYTLEACFRQRERWVLIFTSSLELEKEDNDLIERAFEGGRF